MLAMFNVKVLGMPRPIENAPASDPLVISLPGHRNKYYFQPVSEWFGLEFATNLATLWPCMPGPTASIYNVFSRLFQRKGWFPWLNLTSQSETASPPTAAIHIVVSHLRNGARGVVSAQAFEEVCRAYATFLSGSLGQSVRERRGYLAALKAFCKQFGAEFGLHIIGRDIQVDCRDRDIEQGFPSLAEITRSGKVDWSNPDDAVDRIVHDASVGVETFSFENKLAAVAQLNVSRLAALRRVLEQDLRRAYARFTAGQRILALPDMPPSDEIKANLEGGNYQRQISRWVDRITGGDPEREMHLLLRWMLITAKRGVLRDHNLHYSGYNRLCLRNARFRRHFELPAGPGKMKYALQEYLGLCADGWNAAFGILLIDTGWNIQQLLDLPVRPFIGGATSGKQTIVNTQVLAQFKARAGHEVDAVLAATIREAGADLDCDPGADQVLSGVQIIRMLQEMTASYRDNPYAGPLFLSAIAGSAEPMIPPIATQHHWWRYFVARQAADPSIGGLSISRPMIRKTRIDIAAMQAGADHAPAQLLASHSSAATGMRRYLRSAWFRRALDNHIRRFQDLFEAAVTKDVADVAKHLGVSEEILAGRRDVALETGLGFACLNPFAGHQQSVPAGERCDRVDRCHLGCPARRFVPTEQGLVSLVLTNKSLRDAEGEWVAQNPGRWTEIWMPLLAETEAYLDRLRDSSYRTHLAAAAAKVEADLADGSMSLITPW